MKMEWEKPSFIDISISETADIDPETGLFLKGCHFLPGHDPARRCPLEFPNIEAARKACPDFVQLPSGDPPSCTHCKVAVS